MNLVKLGATIGIPDKTNLGDHTKLTKGQLVSWLVQQHAAHRAGKHYDIRLGTPDTGLYSWASRKGLPEPGQKRLLIQQPLHSYDYKNFEGNIPEGYGAGTVKKLDEQKSLITRSEPDKIHMTLASTSNPQRYAMQRVPKYGDRNWLMLNTTRTKPLDYEKPHYKSLDSDKVESELNKLPAGSSVQEKIDGAAALTELKKLDTLSHRTSKRTGYPITYTEKLFGTMPDISVPKQYRNALLKGEVYSPDTTSQALGGLLNSNIDKSLTKQTTRGTPLRQMIYDITQGGNKPINHDNTPYEERLNMVRDILNNISGPDAQLVRSKFELPTEAKTPEDAIKMWRGIQSGSNKRTDEGIVIHPSLGKPVKAKLKNEHDVIIKSIFPGANKYKDTAAGGFTYAHPDSPDKEVGKVGTGLSDELRRELYNRPEEYVGRTAKILATRRMPSGKLFQPVLRSLHEG